MPGEALSVLQGKEGKRKMRNVLKSFGMTLVAALFLVGAAERASATPVNFFDSTLNDGTGGASIALGAGAHTLNLWATPSVFVYALSPVMLTATGGFTTTTCTAASALALCGAGTATSRLVSWADDINGSAAGIPIHIATILVNNTGEPGTFSMSAGAGVDEAFGDIALDDTLPVTGGILTSVPEPGTLLLLVTGLAGLAVQGRHRES